MYDRFLEYRFTNNFTRSCLTELNRFFCTGTVLLRVIWEFCWCRLYGTKTAQPTLGVNVGKFKSAERERFLQLIVCYITDNSTGRKSIHFQKCQSSVLKTHSIIYLFIYIPVTLLYSELYNRYKGGACLRVL